MKFSLKARHSFLTFALEIAILFHSIHFQINKLGEAKQSIASGDQGITRAELRQRAKAKIARARRK
jgi:hypothetical protein